jgi:hypothetical protein
MQATQDAETLQLSDIAAQIASLYATRDPLKQSLDILDNAIRQLETRAHQTMAAQDMRAFTTSGGVFTVKPKVAYVPTDWGALYAHIVTTSEFDLLHKRLSITALNERDPLAMPPGVARTTFDEFKFTPAKGSKT